MKWRKEGDQGPSFKPVSSLQATREKGHRSEGEGCRCAGDQPGVRCFQDTSRVTVSESHDCRESRSPGGTPGEFVFTSECRIATRETLQVNRNQFRGWSHCHVAVDLISTEGGLSKAMISAGMASKEIIFAFLRGRYFPEQSLLATRWALFSCLARVCKSRCLQVSRCLSMGTSEDVERFSECVDAASLESLQGDSWTCQSA